MAFLYHITMGGSAQCWVVNDKPLVMGRGDAVDAYVEDDALSRSHFLVVRERGEYFVIDLHSSNGTWVDGKKISALSLGSTQTILAGDSLFYFSREPVPADALPKVVPLPFNPESNSPRITAA